MALGRDSAHQLEFRVGPEPLFPQPSFLLGISAGELNAQSFGLLGQFDEHFQGVVQGRIVWLLPVQPIGQLAPGQVEQPNAPRAVPAPAALTSSR